MDGRSCDRQMKTWSHTVSLRWSEQLASKKTSLSRCRTEEDIYCGVKVSSVPFVRHLGHKARRELTLHHCCCGLNRFTAKPWDVLQPALLILKDTFLLGRRTLNIVRYRNRLFTHGTAKAFTFYILNGKKTPKCLNR